MEQGRGWWGAGSTHVPELAEEDGPLCLRSASACVQVARGDGGSSAAAEAAGVPTLARAHKGPLMGRGRGAGRGEMPPRGGMLGPALALTAAVMGFHASTCCSLKMPGVSG